MTTTHDFNRYAWQRRPLIPTWPAKPTPVRLLTNT
jgi:hypothetical protein